MYEKRQKTFMKNFIILEIFNIIVLISLSFCIFFLISVAVYGNVNSEYFFNFIAQYLFFKYMIKYCVLARKIICEGREDLL